jgi:uncharacterized protein YkwD
MRIAIALTLAAVLAVALATPERAAFAGPDCTVDASIDAEEQELLRLINAHRRDNGLDPLALSSRLSRAAAWKARHMAEGDYFSHDDDGTGRNFVDRIRDCGYRENTWLGENIAAGHETALRTFDQWRDSPGHNANMLNEDFRAIGIGRHYDGGSEYGWYWVTDFGGEVDDTAPPPGSTPQRSGDVNCNSATDPVDAALVLQFGARMLTSLACEEEGDVNDDGSINALDASLILQIAAGYFR